MRKVTTLTKTTRLFKIRVLVQDLRSDMTDEEIMVKHGLTRNMLAKVYARLFHQGYLDGEDLDTRLEMRGGNDSAHIPLVRMENHEVEYECYACGFTSDSHFSECPQCRRLNLRRMIECKPSAAYKGRHTDALTRVVAAMPELASALSSR